MKKIFEKFSSAVDYYKMILELISFINNLKPIYIILFFLILLLSAFFEISLLGFLFILIKAFMDPSYYDGNFFFEFVLNIFNIKSNSELILYLCSFFSLTCVFAGFTRLILLKLIEKYVVVFAKEITAMCYQKIIYQDYKNLFNNNVNDSLSIFIKMPIINNSFYVTLNMIYNFVTFIFIFGILSYISFKITLLATLFFFTMYLIIIFTFKKRVFKNASTISNEQSNNIKIARETYNGFRDILINNYQNFYNNIFLKSYSNLVSKSENNRFLLGAPRPILETLLLASVGIIIAINSSSYSALERLLPNIAVMAIASQRILPILNQLYAGHMSNEDAAPHTNFILNFLKTPTQILKKKKIKPLKFKNKISLKNVSFSYAPNEQTMILKNINLDIKAGSRIGIIGKSGSGKSTLADIILGLHNPTGGNFFVDGQDIINQKENWFINVASVPQNIFITEQTIAENIAFGKQKTQINFNEVREAAKKAQISEFIESRKGKYKNVIGEKGVKISAGQRQRIAIARALYKKSKLIIFDEATSSLDEESERNVLNIIFSLSRKNHTSIMISHKISNLKRCDKIYKIQDSKVIKVR